MIETNEERKKERIKNKQTQKLIKKTTSKETRGHKNQIERKKQTKKK